MANSWPLCFIFGPFKHQMLRTVLQEKKLENDPFSSGIQTHKHPGHDFPQV